MGIDLCCIVFEIIESLLMYDFVYVKVLFEELIDFGICFVIDDFGIGYLSFVYLQCFLFVKLKIDCSFVENLLMLCNDCVIMLVVVGFVQILDFEFVVEGVEIEVQCELLMEMGCNYIQGWFVCQVLLFEEFVWCFEVQQLYLYVVV